MGRISHHLKGKDYKKTHQRKLDEQRVLYLERRERQILELEETIINKELSAPYKSDWRKDINEGMTSSGLLQTTLGDQGDTILDTTTWVDYDSSTTLNTGGFGGDTITLSGDPSPYTLNGGIIGFPINIQKYDTLLVDVTTSGTQVRIYGSTANGFPKLLDTTSSGTYTLNISNEKDTSTWTVFSTGSGTVSVSNPRFQRKAPLNVILGLDDPEATNFIRTDPIMRGLSADERRKKLEDMLDAGDEYLLKQVGLQGSAARPADTGNVQSWDQAQYAPGGPNPYGTPGADDPFDSDYYKEPVPDFMEDDPADGLDGIDWMASKGDQIAKNYVPPYVQDWEKLGGGGKGTSPGSGSDRWDPNDDRTWPSIKNLIKKADKKQPVMVAHHEPQGQVISEKKLRSPKEVLKNKIPGYYDGKPAPLGFPDNPPPEMVNGMHPDLVDGKKVADRFNRLDPQSAQAMPLTGNPHIDKKVLKARKQPK